MNHLIVCIKSVILTGISLLILELLKKQVMNIFQSVIINSEAHLTEGCGLRNYEVQ